MFMFIQNVRHNTGKSYSMVPLTAGWVVMSCLHLVTVPFVKTT